MKPWSSLLKVASLTSLGLAAASCDAAAPITPTLSAIDVPRDERAALLKQISSIERLLGGDAFGNMRNGPDRAKADNRRRRAELDLEVLRARANALKRHRAPAANYEIERGEAPPCILNGNLNGCFLDWYTTIRTTGSGTVHQHASTYVSHSTTTFITDNGSPYGSPLTTGGFLNNVSHYGTLSFAAPNCQAADHELLATTSHTISLGISDFGQLEGHQTSSDRAVCKRTYLTVTLSPASMPVNSISTITITNLPPSGCEALSVTSSNGDVAFIEAFGANYIAKSSGAGTATITARCPDGRSGSAVLTVTAPPPPPDDDEECHGEQYTCSDGSDPSNPPGGGSAPPPTRIYEVWCYFISNDGGRTWVNSGYCWLV